MFEFEFSVRMDSSMTSIARRAWSSWEDSESSELEEEELEQEWLR
jgi:hypothetical protein